MNVDAFLGDGKELTRYSKEDGATSRCIVQLQGIHVY